MILELEPIFNNIGQDLDFRYELDLSDLDVSMIHPIQNPAVIQGRVYNRAGVVHLSACAAFDYAAPCDRCAEPTTRHYDIPLEHILVTTLNNEDNDEFVLLDGMRYEVNELIREDIILSLPSGYLCRDDCKGVCQYCGKNLNKDSCSCKAPVDPRLAVLEQLLDN